MLLFAATPVAPEFRATITGRVSDPQNTVIAGVKIVATQIGHRSEV